MSYVPVNTFYLVDSKTFDKYMLRKAEEALDIKQFPKQVLKKIKQILTFLSSVGNKWSILGCIESSADLPLNLNVLSHSAYVVTGKGPEPEHLCTFLKALLSLDVPLKLFCSKVQKKLAAVKRDMKRKNKKNRVSKKEKIDKSSTDDENGANQEKESSAI